jgi:hypothetical protein
VLPSLHNSFAATVSLPCNEFSEWVCRLIHLRTNNAARAVFISFSNGSGSTTGRIERARIATGVPQESSTGSRFACFRFHVILRRERACEYFFKKVKKKLDQFMAVQAA